jgi:transglutaminase-like putative cysteine protease
MRGKAVLISIAAAVILCLPGLSAAAEIHGLIRQPVFPATADCAGANEETSSRLYLARTIGELTVSGAATTDTYEAYFLVPVPFGDQAPILLTVESPELIDYRFLRLTPPNVIVAARMKKAPSTTINWEAWVIVRENEYADLPASAPIPTIDDIPEEIRPWLQPTDCVQSNAPFILEKAAEVKGDTTDLMVLADAIANTCGDIPWEFPHDPIAFDAYYGLKWGNSCTGHAHAGASLFRANGVPSRSLMVMPSWYNGYFDMHWIADYYVPGYGWVRMETSGGMNPYPPHDEIVTMACNPEEEFPLFYPQGIEGYWHTSDPRLGVGNPNWGGAHAAFDEGSFPAAPADVQSAMALTGEVFSSCVDAWGLGLTEEQKGKVQEAYGFQSSALEKIRAGDVAGYIADLQQASASYGQVGLNPMLGIFSDDFEGAGKGWTHGGTQDTWIQGTPSGKPAAAHSGFSCWGNGFSGSYSNNANCWLLSPPFDLRNKSCAYLDFWLYNWVQDSGQTVIDDPLWMELTTDGSTFVPLCSEMGGVNEDPDIPSVGGWSHMVLDLTKYAGNQSVQVRFHFKSDSKVTEPGSFIDDFKVYGREAGSANSLACSVSAEPASGPAPLAVNFTSAVSGGTQPYTYAWAFGDGASSSEANPGHVFTLPGTYTASLTVSDSGSKTATSSVVVTAGGTTPVISAVSALKSPFRLKITGSGFGENCTVTIDGTAAPRTARKSETRLIAGKGPDLKALVPKGVTAQITVVNADGVISAAFPFVR